MKRNLFSRFRNLFRKSEPDYEDDDLYEDSYEDYSDLAVEEPFESEEVIDDQAPAPAPSGGVPNLSYGAEPDPPEPDGSGIHVPLSPIVAGMPLELQSRVLYDVGDLSVFLPLETILPQLSKGVVSLSFGELRNAAPSVFGTDRDQDATEVNVPLSAILPHIGPHMLARKNGPLQMEIPDDIVSPFANRGRGLAVGSVASAPSRGRPAVPGISKAGSPPRRPEPQPIPEPTQRRIPMPQSVAAAGTQQAGPRPSAPVAAPGAPQRPVPSSVPVQSVGTAGPPSGAQPKPMPGAQPKPMPGAPARAAASMQPIQPSASWPTSTGKGTAFTNHPVPGKVSAAQSAAPAPGAPSVSNVSRSPLLVALSAVANAWPDSLKQELIQLSLAEASLAIPYDVVEAGLKRGQLKFAWRKVKSWIAPEVAATVSVHDGTELELPLRVVAPLFINQKKEQPQKTAKVAVDKDIPNLFFGLPQPDTAGLALDHSVNRPLDTNYYVWDDQSDMVPDDARNDVASRARTAGTEFVTRYATPNEVVSRAASLDGVQGAVISLPDGLMVASQLPPGLNGDTLAAFLPHIFGKVTQCTQELRMGELNNLNFTVGNVPWKIFRVNALYFAAFGAKGQPMPTARLAALAAELDHKAKV